MKKNLSFGHMTRLLNEAEETNNLSDAEYEVLIGDIQTKIDNIRGYLSMLESESERLGKLKNEFGQAQATIDKAHERLKTYCIYAMKQNRFKSLSGEKFSLKVMDRSNIILTSKEPTDDQYIRLNAKFPGIVRRVLEWNKPEFKDIVKEENPEDLKDFWQWHKTEYLRCEVNKGKGSSNE